MDAYTQGAAAAAMGGDSDHQSASLMTEEAAAPAAEAGWKVESVSLRKAANGAVIVSCSKTRERTGKERDTMGGREYDSKDYAYSNLDEAIGFIQSEFAGAEASDGSIPTPASPPPVAS